MHQEIKLNTVEPIVEKPSDDDDESEVCMTGQQLDNLNENGPNISADVIEHFENIEVEEELDDFNENGANIEYFDNIEAETQSVSLAIELRNWAVKTGIKHVALNELLAIL